jgi:hypothetical protein
MPAADGGLGADLVVGEPDGAARHFRHSAPKRRIFEKPLDRRRRAETQTLVADLAFVQFRNFRDIN